MGGQIEGDRQRRTARWVGRAAMVGALLAGAALPQAARSADLVDFGDCGQLVRFVRAGVASDEETYPSWVNGSWDASITSRSVWSQDHYSDLGGGFPDDNVVNQDDSDNGTTDSTAAAPSADTAGTGAGDDVSGTNVQEQGVDEPDVVKADGKYLYVVAGSRLRIYSLAAPVPALISQLRLPIAEGRLLRSGNRLLVIGARPEHDADPELEVTTATAPTPTPSPSAPTTTTPATTTPTKATRAATTSAPTTPSSTTPDATTPTTPTPATPTPDALVEATANDAWPAPAKGTEISDEPYARYPFTTRLLEVSIADPAAPALTRTFDAPGTPITARQVGSTVRLVIDASTDPDDEESEDVTIDELRPFTRLESEVSGNVYKRAEVPCADVSRPADGYSGAELLSVLTFDLDRGLVAPQRLGVMATPQTVYASTNTLYVASSVEHDRSTPDGDAGDSSTDIFSFDATEPGKTTYLAHGSVPGLPVNSYAFSEQGGDLRVATSTYAWWESFSDACDDDEDACDEDSDEWGEDASTRMTVLRRDGDELREIGVRGGLDKGEQVSAVRYDGDRAFVAAAADEGDDPLRVLDLSDPTAPRALGELRLPGESTYLHPLGNDLLLAVGRDRSKAGGTYGSRAALYDVGDPAHPKQLAARRLGPGWTPTDYDPHAFLWWPKQQLAFVPYAGWDWYWDESDRDEDAQPSSMVVLKATDRKDGPNLTERGRVTHGPDWDHPDVLRAVVAGDRLLTVSELGISSNRLSDLKLLGTAPFWSAG